jgi:cytochrome P450
VLILVDTGSFPFLTKYPERTLDRWAKKFGDLYSMWLGNQLFVIISDPQVAKDLMVTNGNVFSSRKEMYIKSQTVFAGRGITATPYNDRWSVKPLPSRSRIRTKLFRRKHRRIASTWLTQKAVDTYSPILDRESRSLIKALFEEGNRGKTPINPQVSRTTLEAPRKLMMADP